MFKNAIRRTTMIIFTLIALMLVIVPVAAQPPSNDITGVFTTIIDTNPATCASPVGFCSNGTVTGDIEGDVEVVLSSAVFGADENGIPTLFYSTDITITAQNGTWSGVSNGQINLFTNGLTAVFELTEGTGFYTNRVATLNVIGTSNPETGVEVLPFTGTTAVVPRNQR